MPTEAMSVFASLTVERSDPISLMELLQLPESMSSVTGGVIIVLAMITALIGAVFGLGGGTILLATMAQVLPPSAVISLHAVAQMGANAGRAGLMFSHIKKDCLLPFAIGSGLGSLASGLLFFELPPWMLQYVMAAFIVWSVIGKVSIKSSHHIIGAGALSGFLTIMVGATGPFVAALTRTFDLPKLRHVGTHAALMTIQHSLKIGILGLLGFAYGPYTFLLIMMLLSGLVGTAVGRSLLMKMPDRNFRPLLNTILTLLALSLAWQATHSMLGF